MQADNSERSETNLSSFITLSKHLEVLILKANTTGFQLEKICWYIIQAIRSVQKVRLISLKRRSDSTWKFNPEFTNTLSVDNLLGRWMIPFSSRDIVLFFGHGLHGTSHQTRRNILPTGQLATGQPAQSRPVQQ